FIRLYHVSAIGQPIAVEAIQAINEFAIGKLCVLELDISGSSSQVFDLKGCPKCRNVVSFVKGEAGPCPYGDHGPLKVKVFFKIKKGSLVVEYPYFIAGLKCQATFHLKGKLAVCFG